VRKKSLVMVSGADRRMKNHLYSEIHGCWRRLKIDHPYRLKIDQGKLLYSVLYSIEIVDQTELVLNLFFY